MVPDSACDRLVTQFTVVAWKLGPFLCIKDGMENLDVAFVTLV
jgi:hypothetical protein